MKNIYDEKEIKESLNYFELARKNYNYYFDSNNFFIKCSDGKTLSFYFKDLNLYSLLGISNKELLKELYSYDDTSGLKELEEIHHRKALYNLIKEEKINFRSYSFNHKASALNDIRGFTIDNLVGVIEFSKPIFHLTGGDLNFTNDFYLLMLDRNQNLFLLGLDKTQNKNNNKENKVGLESHILCRLKATITSFNFNEMFNNQKVSFVTNVSCKNSLGEIYETNMHPDVLDKNKNRLKQMADFFGMHYDTSNYCSYLQTERNISNAKIKELEKEKQELIKENEELKTVIEHSKTKVKKLFKSIIE